MYQPIEVTSARTVWIDSPSEERLGFHDSSRVQIDRDPTGVTDWNEPGEAYQATLMGGMWPDDDELRLLVVGVVPGGEQADAYLYQLVSGSGKTLSDDDNPRAIAWDIIRTAVDIMPAWQGQSQRSIFVRLGTLRGTPQTVITESQKEPDRSLTFDMWRIQVDAKLIASGRGGTDGLTERGLVALKKDYDTGVSPSDYAHAYISTDI